MHKARCPVTQTVSKQEQPLAGGHAVVSGRNRKKVETLLSDNTAARSPAVGKTAWDS